MYNKKTNRTIKINKKRRLSTKKDVYRHEMAIYLILNLQFLTLRKVIQKIKRAV